MDYRRDIDGLRAVAVGAVVLYHAGLPVPGGFAGVDVFFVISGFLIGGIIRRELRAGEFSFARFYERRARRILPALTVVLLATVPAAFVWLLPSQLRDYDESLRGAMLFASNFVFAGQSGYFESAAELKPLLHTWSLAVEEQFYIVIPVLLWFVRGRWAKPALVALAAVSFAWAAWESRADPATAFFMPHLRAWELLAGVLIALGVIRLPEGRLWRELGGAAGLSLILIAVLMLDSATAAFPGPAALLPVAGAGLVILARGSLANRLLGTAPMVGIGLISYSLYLWHWPLFVFHRLETGRAPEPAEAAVLIAVSVAAAWASWRFVERPFRRAGVVSRRGLVRVLGGGAVVVLALSVVGDWSDGLRVRYPAEVQAALSARDDWRRSPGRRCLDRLGEAEDPLAEAPEVCRMGPEGAPRVVLWGDSHAAALQAGLAEWAEATGTPARALTRSACPPVAGLAFSGGRARDRGCAAFNEGVLAHLLESRPAAVVLSARWPFRLDPEAPGAAAPEAMEAALRETVARLRAAGIATVAVLTVPTHDGDVPERAARARLRGGEDAGTPESAHAAAAAAADALVAGAGAEALVRPAEALCRGGVCRTVAEGAVLYGDASHLSPEGARRLTPALAEALAAAVREGPG